MHATGACHVLFLFDVAHDIDLERVRSLAGATAPPLPARGLYVEPLPMRFRIDAQPLSIAGHAGAPGAEVTLYDFGAVSLGYTVPLDAPLADWVEVMRALMDGEDLRRQVSRDLDEVLLRVGPAVHVPVPERLVEDYVTVHLRTVEPPVDAATLASRYGTELSRLLRGERGPLSADEVRDATEGHASFSPDDLAVIDWNAAVVLDPGPTDEIRTVLEIANVQLLELRFLDRQLDLALEGSHARVARQRSRRWLGLGGRADLQAVGSLQVDGAVLHERIAKAIRLHGEPYVARVYRLAAQQLRLAEWSAEVGRKLAALDSIYQKLWDRDASRRIELLEWIVIVLILVEIIRG